MNITLLDFQEEYIAELLKKLSIAKVLVTEGQNTAVSFSAPTGSGKTVMMASLIEHVFNGDDSNFIAEPDAVFLWLSDQPALNEQSLSRIKKDSSLNRNQLVMIDTSFDEEYFVGGKVYFINTQKLGKDKSLTNKGHGDKRNWTLWETLNNTITKERKKFYLIVDEAHRGMNKTRAQEAEAASITQKFILGSKGEPYPVPIVIGVSATPERFQNLVKGSSRISLEVNVDPSKVKASGLLKDQMTVRIASGSEASDFSLLSSSAFRWKSMWDEWESYCLEQEMAPMRPILVVQVEDSTKDKQTGTNLSTAMSAIEESIGPMRDEYFVHCFQETSDIEVKGRKIRRVDPSQVQSDTEARFVFFKMALTTGWDCPRAEVMMSFRKAKDATYIAQLVGRMVRSPLARRIEGSETLNEVHLYLPHYDQKNLTQVIEKLKSDPDNVPVTEVKVASELIELSVPEVNKNAFEAINGKPTYSLKKARKMPDIRRLLKFAALLEIDGINEHAISETTSVVVNYFLSKLEIALKTDLEFSQQVNSHETIEIQRLVIDQSTYDTLSTDVEFVRVSDHNMVDLFKSAKQRATDEVAIAWLSKRISAGQDPITAKLELYLLLQRFDVLQGLEDVSLSEIKRLKQENDAKVANLLSSKRSRYNELWALAKKAEATSLELPSTISVSKESNASSWENHLFQEKEGGYKAKLNSWEEAVVREQLENPCVWLRNIQRKPWSLAYVYKSEGSDQLGYPDFLFVREVMGDTIVDIIEPHNLDLADSVAKAQGLANFADNHGEVFGKIELVIMEGKRLRRINFNDPSTRRVALRLQNNDELLNIFKAEGYY